MKINLRKAAALQAAIRTHVRDKSLNGAVVIREFESDVDGRVAKARHDWEKDASLKMRLIEALFEIRNKVAGANARAGVNKILAEVEMMKMQAAAFMVQSCAMEEVPVVEIEAEMRKASAHKNSYGGMEVYSARFGFRSAEEIESDESQSEVLRKKAKELEDSLLGINVQTEISVSDEAEAAMIEANIL